MSVKRALAVDAKLVWAHETMLVAASDYDIASERIAQLEAALRKAHGVIRSCVTSGVLRHDLNCFLAEESSVLENEVSK
jgi:hypothetical protein